MKSAFQPTLNWDIRMEPLMINNTIDIGKMAIVRNDNNKLIPPAKMISDKNLARIAGFCYLIVYCRFPCLSVSVL